MAKRFMARQGDVLIMAAEIPAKAKAVDHQERIILALGEHTGHAHAITLEPESDVTLYTVADEVDAWLRIRARTETVRHEEHRVIALPVADYVVKRQVEYFPQELRQVAD